ncbi:hypothetical protein D3C86_1461970 [compost metagenome]
MTTDTVTRPGSGYLDLAEHQRATLAHLIDFAALDAGYARWRAGELASENPEWHGELPAALDIALSARGIKFPPPFVEPESKVPALTKGRRGLPKRKYFHDHP